MLRQGADFAVEGRCPIIPRRSSCAVVSSRADVDVHAMDSRAVSSAGEHSLHTRGVTGSIPVLPIESRPSSVFALAAKRRPQRLRQRRFAAKTPYVGE